jgi:excisionase family DNA binding protein
MNSKKQKEYYTLKEVANLLNLTHTTVMRHARENILKTVIIGKSTKRVTKQALEEYTNKNQ